MKKPKNIPKNKLGLTREWLGGMAYRAFIKLNSPVNLKRVDTEPIYDEDGLEIWIDREGKKITGIEIHYYWRQNDRPR